MFDVRPMPHSCDDALISAARAVEPATIGHFRLRGFPDPGIRPLVSPRPRMVGTAVTLALPGFDSTMLHHVVGALRPGDILLIDRLGDRRYACLGGGVASALAARGIQGAIVDGPCADPEELEASGLGVWGTGISALTTRIPGYGGAMNVPVSIGGAVVLPGDLVIADSGGIVAVPIDEAVATVSKALDLQRQEQEFFAYARKDVPFGERTGATGLVRKAIGGD